MADAARKWQVLTATATRLQEVTVANGYRTDAGNDVRTEPWRGELEAPRITLYCGHALRGDQRNEREFDLIVEVAVPVAMATAQETLVAAEEDIEQALDRFLPVGGTPLEFEESIFLDKPDGLAVMAVQMGYSTRYRR